MTILSSVIISLFLAASIIGFPRWRGQIWAMRIALTLAAAACGGYVAQGRFGFAALWLLIGALTCVSLTIAKDMRRRDSSRV